MRKSAPRRRNPARQAKEKLRAYGPKKRREWISAHGCLACARTPCVNAHTKHPSAGGSYKGDYVAIVPLCPMHEDEKHHHGEDTFNARHAVMLCGRTLASWAETYQSAWEKWSVE